MEKQWQTTFLGSKITADGDCSHEIKRRLLLERKVTLPTKVRLVKATVFPVVMYGYEIWLYRKLSAEEYLPLNCGVVEDS